MSNIFGQSSGCQITEISVDNKSGYVQWTVENTTTKIPFTIEHYKWDKWVKVGEMKADSGTTGQFGYGIWQHKGENKVRVYQAGQTCPAKIITWVAAIKEVKVSIDKKHKKIKFNRYTMFEVFDLSGKLIDKGAAKNILYKNTPSGTYILYFDNSTLEIKI